jgi:hypothetical protein
MSLITLCLLLLKSRDFHVYYGLRNSIQHILGTFVKRTQG